MSWQRTPYVLPMLAAAAVSTAAALYVFMRRHRSPRSRIGVLLLLAGAVWMLGAALETASADLSSKILWDKLQFVGICIIPPACLSYALCFTGHDRWLTPTRRIALSVVPGITLLLVLTNETHGLIWREAWLDTSGPYAVKQAIYGPALWAFMAYAYALLLVAVVLLVRELVRSGRLYRWQATALLVAVMTPWLLNILEQVLGWTALSDMELTPLALAVAVPVIAWSSYRLQVRDIVPVAREAVLDSMDDALVILDTDERIIDLNRAAQSLAGQPRSDLLGKRVVELWPGFPTWAARYRGEDSLRQQIKLDQDGQQRTFSLRTSPVTDRRGRTIAHVVALHDISELQRRTDVLAAVLEATKAVSSSLDLDQVLGLIAEEMLNAAGADGCTLSQWDREQDAVVTWVEKRRVYHGRLDEAGSAYPLRWFPLTRSVLEARKPRVVRLSDPDADPQEIALMQSQGTETLLMLPLAHRNSIIGLVELESERDRQFTPDEIRMCELLADQAAVAIEHARLYQESKRRQEELSALLESGMAITASLDLEDILVAVAEAAVFLLKATGAHVCRWDSTHCTTTVLAKVLDTAASAREGGADVGATYTEQSFVGHIVENRQPYPLRLSDPDLREDWRRYLEEYGGKSALLLPLVHEEKTAIYLVVWESRHDRRFTENQVLLARNLVSQAAVALENARLHAETERRLREQVALREAVSAIASTLDIEVVLARVAEQLGRAVSATSAYISRVDLELAQSTVLAEFISESANEEEKVSDLGATYQEADSEFLRDMSQGLPHIEHVDDAELAESDRKHMIKYGAKSVLHIPLFTRGQIIGYAELWESRRRREFTADEVALCQAIAHNAAVALEKARLYEQAQQDIAERTQMEAVLRQRNRELVSLQAASTALISSLDRQFILDTVAWEMANLLEVDSCTILEWDREGDTVSVIADHGTDGLDERAGEPGGGHLADYPLRHRAISERRALQTTVSASALEPAALAHLQQVGAKTLLVLPLVFQDKVLGLVEIKESHVERSFDDHESTLAQMLASQAATAIENARLYEQAQQEIAVRKQAERALERYAADLEQSNQELQQFAYIASHDLQEPLRMVTSYLQLLEQRYKGKLDASADDFIHFAVDGANRMRELIQGLLAYSRVETRGTPLQAVDSQAVLEQVLKDLQIAIAENQALVTHDPLPTVLADAIQLSQVFQNLISNAVKFRGDRRPAIHVGVENDDTEWQFSVRDNGIGIEPQHTERIFAIFQRLHTRHEYPGTGIGLAVCKRIVERHGGRIWVESEPGQGSTFFFTIPRQNRQDASRSSGGTE